MKKSIAFNGVGFRHKEDKLYVIHNKKLDIYKFGITSKPIEHRINNYCKHKVGFHLRMDSNFVIYSYDFSVDDIELVYCKSIPDCQNVEKQLMKIINGFRVKLEGGNQPLREHFYKEKLDDVLNYLQRME